MGDAEFLPKRARKSGEVLDWASPRHPGIAEEGNFARRGSPGSLDIQNSLQLHGQGGGDLTK
jgi:hypothetical protein